MSDFDRQSQHPAMLGQHHIQHDHDAFTNELEDIHKIIPPENLHHGWNPKQSYIFVPKSLQMRTLKNKTGPVKDT